MKKYRIKHLIPKANIFILLVVFTTLTLLCQTLKADGDSYKIVKLSEFQANAAFFGTPLVTKNLVVIGSHDKSIYFFNHSGKLIRQYKTNGFVHATAEELKDGRIVIGSYDKSLYIFSPRGRLMDKIRLGGRIFTNVIENIKGELVFGCNNSVVFLNSITKSVKKIRTKNLIHGSIKILSSGNIAIGSNDKKMYIFNSAGDVLEKYRANGWIIHSEPLELSNGLIVFGSYDNRLHFTTIEGKPVGKIKIGGHIHSTPIETENHEIVFGAFDGIVYYISLKGKIQKQFTTGGRIVASPILMPDGNIIIGSYDKQLYLLSKNGQELARYDTDGKIFSSPKLINDSTIVCATTNGKIEFLNIQKKHNDSKNKTNSSSTK